MSLIGSVMDKVMHRGLYKSCVGDKLITQCEECRHNLREHNPVPFMKDILVHRCEQEWNVDGTHKILIDPHGIPDWCPFKIVDMTEGVKV